VASRAGSFAASTPFAVELPAEPKAFTSQVVQKDMGPWEFVKSDLAAVEDLFLHRAEHALHAEKRGLAHMDCFCPITGMTGKTLVPAAWEDKLLPGSLRLKFFEGAEQIISAKLASRPSFKVSFKTGSQLRENTVRELRLMDHMCSVRHRSVLANSTRLCSGHVLAYFDATTLPKDLMTFFLMEPREGNLEQLLISGPLSDKVPYLPLETSLPLLNDVLTGFHALEIAGMVHGAPSPENIVICHKEGTTPRAVLSGLRAVCLVGDKDPMSLVGPAALADDGDYFETSAFHQPPEVVDGAPAGFGDHAWAAGVLFAHMLFGYNPVETETMRRMPNDPPSDLDPVGRKQIREMLAGHFSIADDPTFKKLDPDLQHLLSGLMNSERQNRFATSKAKELVRKIAGERGINLPKARRRPRLPDSW